MVMVCLCAGVTDQEIAALAADGATTLGEITRRCGAGRSCPPCQEEIESILYNSRGDAHTPPPMGACDAFVLQEGSRP